MSIIPIHENIRNKLDSFIESKKIPHIIFHGQSGTGKISMVFEFLHKIYNYDKTTMKFNIMFVNCAHGKGIKFIREDLKLFAKTNIQCNRGVLFKSIVLLNADFLTIDAQSALRRCIEQFSLNTRFFIIVQNKNKLLNPILSRFCEIYFPEFIDENNEIINLHQYQLGSKYKFENLKKVKYEKLCEIMEEIKMVFITPTENVNHILFAKKSEELYMNGYSAIDVNKWIQNLDIIDEGKKSTIELCFEKVKSEYHCEKLLILYIFNQLHDLIHCNNNVEWMNKVSFV